MAWASVVLLVGTLVLLIAEGRRRHGLYWYDVEADYQYVFPDSALVPVEISPTAAEIPAIAGAWDTALLRITVDSTVSAYWFEPWIEIDCPARTSGLRQFFERRAHGARFVNVSCIFGDGSGGARRVQMQGHHLGWQTQKAELLVFRNEPVAGRRILVLAPHPDDAEIAAFGLYAAGDSFVVTVSAGNYADARLSRLFHNAADRSLASGRLRTWDSIVVPSWGGVPPSRSVNLGYFNGSLEAMHSVPDTIVADDRLGTDDIGIFRRFNISEVLADRTPVSSWRSLVEDLRVLVERYDPEIIVAPHPVLDASSDHVFSTLALFEALDQLESRSRRLFLYTNHHTGTEYFPFGPAEGIVTLGPWFDEDLPLRGVYSHPLPEEAQLDKLFALDAMHDLRTPPKRRGSSPGERILDRLSGVVLELWNDPTDSYSYYRRAVRPNELFLTYATGDRAALVARLERSKPRPAED